MGRRFLNFFNKFIDFIYLNSFESVELSIGVLFMFEIIFYQSFLIGNIQSKFFSSKLVGVRYTSWHVVMIL